MMISPHLINMENQINKTPAIQKYPSRIAALMLILPDFLNLCRLCLESTSATCSYDLGFAEKEFIIQNLKSKCSTSGHFAHFTEASCLYPPSLLSLSQPLLTLFSLSSSWKLQFVSQSCQYCQPTRPSYPLHPLKA